MQLYVHVLDAATPRVGETVVIVPTCFQMPTSKWDHTIRNGAGILTGHLLDNIRWRVRVTVVQWHPLVHMHGDDTVTRPLPHTGTGAPKK
jgi:hypothetical protein